MIRRHIHVPEPLPATSPEDHRRKPRSYRVVIAKSRSTGGDTQGLLRVFPCIRH